MSIYAINSVYRGQFLFKESLTSLKDEGLPNHFHEGVVS